MMPLDVPGSFFILRRTKAPVRTGCRAKPGPAGAGPAALVLVLVEIVADTNAPPLFSRVPHQPASYNNVMACYGTDGRILFACDRPRNGSSHLYPQLDEYTYIPSNSGLWSLDPASGDLFHLDHSPSGDFHADFGNELGKDP